MSSLRAARLGVSKAGFTVIEVMLFLAITGVLLIAVLSGTYAGIANQRYNDSIRTFAEFLRQIYGEVLSPETLGTGNSNQFAIYGKIAVFGLDTEDGASDDQDHNVYTATLVGDVNIPNSSTGFVDELGLVNAQLFCGDESMEQDSTVKQFMPAWGTKINNAEGQPFRGTVIIARSPTSGTVHTAYSEDIFRINEHCQPDDRAASSSLQNAIKDTPESFSITDDINFCLRSHSSSILRDIRLTADGHNTSAVNILSTDDPEDVCH